MKKILPFILLGLLGFPRLAFAASNAQVDSFTHDSLSALIGLAGIATVFFLVRGGYLYITSTGNPASLDEAKRTIKNALLGLVIVIGAAVFSSLLSSAFSMSAGSVSGTALSMSPIEPVAASSSLTQILMDAISGFLQTIVQSVTKPVLDAIMGFLTNTPLLSTNSVVFNFWLVMVGITDSLFALVIALLGFQVMSASTFGFEELSLKELWPRIGLSFVLANTSIFLIDWIIQLCGTLVSAVLNATGGIGGAWIINTINPTALLSGGAPLITLIFLCIFLILAVVLLLFYIIRLMLLAFGAVMSPLVSLIWLIPKWSDFAISSFKAYIINIFSLFVHVVIIQLSSAFLTVPGQVGANPIISILIAIALFCILLKSTALTLQLALASSATQALKGIGGQILNVLSPATKVAPRRQS